MDICTISLTAQATGTDLSLAFYLDGDCIGEILPGSDPCEFRHEFPDQVQEHVFEIKLSGKQPEHTVLDHQGSILQDRVIEIRDFSIDGDDHQQLLCRLGRYQHDNNGSSDIVTDDFFGVMGCNGVVRLEFETPTHVWLLQHM